MTRKQIFPLAAQKCEYYNRVYTECIPRALSVNTGYDRREHNRESYCIEVERLRRLTFFRMSTRYIYDVQQIETPHDFWHRYPYWALMTYWLRAWEMLEPGLSGDWDPCEYEIRLTMLQHLVSAEWLVIAEKKELICLTYHDYPRTWRDMLADEVALMTLAARLFYDGGLCFSIQNLEQGIPLEHVFPIATEDISFEGYRANTGRPL